MAERCANCGHDSESWVLPSYLRWAPGGMKVEGTVIPLTGRERQIMEVLAAAAGGEYVGVVELDLAVFGRVTYGPNGHGDRKPGRASSVNISRIRGKVRDAGLADIFDMRYYFGYRLVPADARVRAA